MEIAAAGVRSAELRLATQRGLRLLSDQKSAVQNCPIDMNMIDFGKIGL